MRRTFRTTLVAGLVLGAFAAPARAAEEVVVFAAASLSNALDAVAAAFEAETGHRVSISHGGSNTLARQILAGAPADIFVSAAVNWMDAVDQGRLVVPGTRVDLLGNRLVLIAHGRDVPAVPIGPGLDLALVDAVPAGQYGKAALQHFGLWDAVAPQVAQADNVRAALALVARGEAPLGIVYASDAVASDAVTVLGEFPADSHPPITYPAALLTGAADAADRAFFEALQAPLADAAFAAQGFAVPD
jgi:molybdate transport system substrate-binding protein